MPSLKELRARKNNISALQDKVSNKRQVDERFWRATRDKAGNANTVIRFLPQADLDAAPYVLSHKHFFQDENSGKYFVENCPTTNGDPCPVCESNGRYWRDAKVNGVLDRDLVPDAVKKRGKKYDYIANILVVKDPGNPENEGKVFLFKFGKSIFKMIAECIKPTFEDDVSINPFHVDEGANFNFKIIKKGEYANYDKSAFMAPSVACDGDDDALEKVIGDLYPLEEFLHKDDTKSYEELQTKFFEVTGEGGLNEVANNQAPVVEDEQDDSSSLPDFPEENNVQESADDVDTDFGDTFNEFFGKGDEEDDIPF